MESNVTANTASELRLLSHIPQLDGVRGLAILAVMLVHSADRLSSLSVRSAFRYGWVGVDLFFVLSGFLITGILLKARGTDHFFRNFYARRALRVWPLYYFVLTVAFGLVPFMVHHYGLEGSSATDGRGAALYVLFLQNLWHSSVPFVPTLTVTWSLAIEEQFYVVWPALVFLLSPKTLSRMLVIVLVLSPLARGLALREGVAGLAIYVNTLSRLDGLAIGCLLAIVVHSQIFTRVQIKSLSVVAFVAGAMLAAFLIPAHITEPANPFAFSALAVAFCGFVGLALTSSLKTGWFGRMLASRGLAYLGTISYCVYLIHLPIFLAVSHVLRKSVGSLHDTLFGDLVFIIAAFGLTCGIAAASWQLFEQPILRLKDKFVSSTNRPKAGVIYCSPEVSV